MSFKIILILFFIFFVKINFLAQKDTVYTYFDDDKSILKSIELYENKKLDGVCLTYYPLRGLEYSVTYNNGLKDGIFKYYYKNGKIKQYRVYDNEKLVWQASYNPKGAIDFEEIYYKDKMIRTMYKNGVPEFNW